MTENNLDDNVNNFRYLCIKEFMHRIGLERMRQSPVEGVELIQRKGKELLDKAKKEIAAYALPQQIKDVLRVSAYARYVSNTEDSITQREIFGDCAYCSRAGFPEGCRDLYCSEFQRNCFDMERAGNIPCIKFDRLDISKMSEVRRAIAEFVSSGEDRDLDIARELLEKARAEIRAKYKNLRAQGRILPY